MRCFIVFDFYVFELFNCMSVDVCIVVSWVAANGWRLGVVAHSFDLLSRGITPSRC